MIQRKQSLYLLAAILSTSFLFFGALIGVKSDDSIVVSLLHFKQSSSGISFLLLAVLFMVIDLLSIFMFKNRKRQMLFIRNGIYTMAAFIILLGITFFRFRNIHSSEVFIGWPSYFALLAIVFNVLAFRGVKKDDELVRSADRIR